MTRRSGEDKGENCQKEQGHEDTEQIKMKERNEEEEERTVLCPMMMKSNFNQNH